MARPTKREGKRSILDYLHKGPWWRNRGLLILNICLLIPLMTSVVNGIDSSLVNGTDFAQVDPLLANSKEYLGLQISDDWDTYFHKPRGKLLGLVQSAQFIGNLCSLPLTALASDRLGRRGALFVGAVVMCVGVALQATAVTIATFIGSRFTVGFGLSFCQNAAPLLLIELSYPTHRGRITALYNSSWYFGSILSAWICFTAFNKADGTQWSWRVPTIAQALLPVIQIASVWFIPESPRWLISKGLESRAAEVLVKYHARGSDERDPLVVFEMAQIRHALRMEEETNRQTSYKSLFTVPGNRKRMRLILAIAVFSQWSGNGLVSYYINLVLDGVGIDNTNTKAIVNGCLQIFNFVIAATASMLVDVVGRRPLFLISNGGMFVSFSTWTITTALYNAMGNIDAAKATIPLIFVFYFFYDLAYTPLLVAYALEILPFRVRAKGFSVMNFTIMATVAFNQFVNPWALDSISWWYYIVYSSWLIVELVFVYFFIVETKGRTLEETAALFDSEKNSGDLQDLGGQAAAMSEKLVQKENVQTAPRNDDSDSKQYEMLAKKQSRAGSSSASTA